MNIQSLKDNVKTHLQKHKAFIVAMIIVVVLALTVTFTKPIKNDSPLVTPQVSLQVPLTSTLTATPKVSPQDPDVIVNQTYTAKVNGQTLTVPVLTPKGTTQGTPSTGILEQTIDLTPIYSKAKEEAIKEAKTTYKKNYEVGTGIGVHDGSYYIPVEIQRNYKAGRGVSLELHLEPKGITGGAVKWKMLL